jgi:hypothetical protein
MSYSDAIASLETMLTNSGLLGVYKGYTTVPFNYASTAEVDPDTRIVTIAEPIGLRGTATKQQYAVPSFTNQTLFLGRQFLLHNNEITNAFLVASELGIDLLTAINNWGVQCGKGVYELSDLSALPQVSQSDRIAQALRAIAGSPNNPTTTSTYWYAQVVVSFGMKFTT